MLFLFGSLCVAQQMSYKLVEIERKKKLIQRITSKQSVEKKPNYLIHFRVMKNALSGLFS